MATVVGTSGFTPERLERLGEMWGSDGPPALVVPNFSIGAVLMMRFAADAAPHFESVEVIERHHSTKPDAPSGTALATAMGLAAAGGSSASGSAELVAGARGGDVEGVRVHALRLPGLISQQEVALSNAGAGGEQVWNLITTGAFISVLPLLLSFLFLQRYWQGGLTVGSTFNVRVAAAKASFAPLTVSVTGQSVHVDMIADAQ